MEKKVKPYISDFNIYIYIYIYIYVDMCSPYLFIFFAILFFFQGRKRLTFFEHMSNFVISKDEFDFK